jgi:dTDP-glucose 4,6-dehydratase/UDP-glucose 4-epimerase
MAERSLPQRLLVTGGTGFIGAALVRRLVAEGRQVRVLDNNSRGALRRLDGVLDGVDLIEGDIRDVAVVTAAVKGVDCVVHLAAVNGTEFFYSKPELVLDVGVRGMLAVVDACRANGVRDLVVASSSEAYQTPPITPTPENIPLVVPDVRNARYSYGGSKIASELIAMNYGRTGFDRVTVFRPHNVYGPDMGWEHVLPQLSLRAHEAAEAHPTGPVPLTIQGDGAQTRAFVHIDDFTNGLMTVIDRGEHLEIYHIGTTDELTIRQVAEKVVESLGRQAAISTSELPVGGTNRRCPDIDKLKNLGYRPLISFDAGLPTLVDWYVANRNLKP